MNHSLRWAVPLLALSLAPLLAANAAAPEPGGAASAAAPYHSAFADYKPWRDIPPGDWRNLDAGAVGSAMAAMPEMSTASEPSHDHPAMHGGADAHSMPSMQGMSPALAPAARAPAPAASAAPHSTQSMQEGHR